MNVSELLERYFEVSGRILEMGLYTDNDIDELDLLIDERGEILNAISKLEISSEDRISFGRRVLEVDEKIIEKINLEAENVKRMMSVVKQGKLEQGKKKVALRNYSGKRSATESVYFDKNT